MMDASLLAPSADALAAETARDGAPPAPKRRGRWRRAHVARCRELVAAAIALLHDEALPVERVVHDVRRAMKELEALMRLAPRKLAGEAEACRRTARGVRQALGAARDASVARQTLAELPPAPGSGAARKRLDELLAAAMAGVAALTPAERGRHAERLADLAAEVGGWPIAGGPGFLRNGLARTHRRALRRMPARFKEAAPEELHEFRKAVVALRYQTVFARKLWPRVMEAFAAEAQHLRDRLGTVNDLALLQTQVDRHAAALSPRGRGAIEAAIEARRSRQLRRAQRLARRLFAEPAAAFEARIGAYLGAGGKP